MLYQLYRDAVKNLDFAYQPIIDFRNGKAFAFEALLRNCEDIDVFFDNAYILTQITVSKIKSVKSINWLILGSILAMLGYFLISFIFSPIQLTIAYLITTIGFGILIPAYMTITANSVEAHEQGVAAGTVSSMNGFAVILAPLLSTALYEIDLIFPFVFSGVAFLILIFISLFYRKNEL